MLVTPDFFSLQRFVCPKCGRSFTQTSSLYQHDRNVHLKIRDHECPICHKRFLRREHLRGHWRIHEKAGANLPQTDPFGTQWLHLGVWLNYNFHSKVSSRFGLNLGCFRVAVKSYKFCFFVFIQLIFVHNDIMKCEHILRYWPFVWGIHRWITPTKSEWCRALVMAFVLARTNFQLIEAEWRIYASVNQPSLVQIMACRLDGAKPLSEPMMEYC